MARAAQRRTKRFALYWCTTPDGDEDWFVVADSAATARRFHEAAEGYCRGDAHAERAIALPDALVTANGWRDSKDGKVPHVSDGGHKTLLRQGFEKHYVSMPCVGGYVDGHLPSAPNKSLGMRAITNGADKNYGNKPLGLFQASDRRFPAAGTTEWRWLSNLVQTWFLDLFATFDVA